MNIDIQRAEMLHCDEYEGVSCIKWDNSYYYVDKDGNAFRTPRGNILSTNNRKLADRIFDDIISYGLDDMGAYSILPWHYTLLDNFAQLEKESVIEILTHSFLTKKDWTFIPEQDTWRQLFGSESSRTEEIKHWLSKCSIMQMTAACCIGNAYHSINMAFSMAKVLEQNSDDGRRLAMSNFSKLVAKATEPVGLGSAFDVMQDFDTFELYYGAGTP